MDEHGQPVSREGGEHAGRGTPAEREALKELLLERLGLRVGDEMADYIGRKVVAKADTFAIMGGDARTGVPVRRLVALAEVTGSGGGAGGRGVGTPSRGTKVDGTEVTA